MAPNNDGPISYDINLPYIDLTEDTKTSTRYPECLPSWDKMWYESLKPFEYQDPAL